MPARSNRRQAVVYFVKKHRAPAGASVTESEFLHDAQTNEDREVDVVVRCVVGDDPVLISVEVTDRKSRADVTWVDSMLMKHSHMPTNRLLLVSWSGFSRGALAKVVAQGGRVEAITPTRADSLEVRAKFLQHVETHPTRIALHVTDSEHERWLTQVPLQAALYSLSDGQEVGTVAMLVERLSYRSSEQISKDVYCHPERDALTHFTLGNDALEPAGLCVDLEGLRLPVLGIEVVGELQIGGHELPWEFWQLGPALFAIAEIEMATGPVLYVLSPREDGSETLSWRPLA